MVFAMVANRALAPSSKLHMEQWVAEEALPAFMKTARAVEFHTPFYRSG